MNTKIAFSAVSFFILSQISFANSQPLLGSAWSKANPGILPYEECHLSDEDDDRGVMDSTDLSLAVVATNPFKNGGSVRYLACSAPKLGLRYKVPLTFTSRKMKKGVLVNFPFTVTFHSRVKVADLKDKTLRDFYGSYDGTNIAAGVVLIGGEGAFLSNDRGVKIRPHALNHGKVFELSTLQLRLEAADSVQYIECVDPAVIINGDTATRRDKTQCISDGLTAVDKSSIAALRFVKIAR